MHPGVLLRGEPSGRSDQAAAAPARRHNLTRPLTVPEGHERGATARSGRYVVLVGGVPGAGKSTAITRACGDLDHVIALDPEHVAGWLRRHLPPGVPYGGYRWLVHLVHLLRVVQFLVSGPRAGRQLVVHDPGTREWRRRLFALVTRLAGWRTILVYIDVDRHAAQDGQVRRGRVVRSFERHWHRWDQLRPALLQRTHGHERGADRTPVVLVDRGNAAAVLREICLA